MVVGVLTYNIKHRKTYDTLCLLKAKGYENVVVYAAPLQYVKKFHPIIQHRPNMPWDVDTQEVCRNFGYKYVPIKSINAINSEANSIFLVCGAGVISKSFVDNHTIINSHPGYIPYSRGLDALKWAINERQPIGVTVHLLGDEIDAGKVILRKKIPIYKEDTFHAVAQRVYENEIAELVNAIDVMDKNKKLQYISGEGYLIHKRMPKDIEKNLLADFEDFKSMYVEK